MLAELPTYESATGINPGSNEASESSESESPEINIEIPSETESTRAPLDKKKLGLKRGRCLFMMSVDLVIILLYLTSFVHKTFSPTMLLETLGLLLSWSLLVASIFIPSRKIKFCGIYILTIATFSFLIKVLVSVVMIAVTSEDYASNRTDIARNFVLFVFCWGSLASFIDFFSFVTSDLFDNT